MDGRRITNRGIAVGVATATAVLLMAAGAQATPVLDAPPSIAGSSAGGSTLTETAGTWTTAGTLSLAEQWYDCTSSDPASCTDPIAGATGSSYTTGSSDAGQYVAVIETADDGTPPTAPATSNLIGPIVPPAPTNTTPPTIAGTAAAGTLTESHGDWTDSPTSYTYQWLSCTGTSADTCSAIGGATAQTYTVPAAADGLGYEVRETAANAGGTGAPATSSELLPPVPANTALPAVTGTIAVGDTLTTSTGTWDNGPTSYGYQWERCVGATCSAIIGATASTYVLASADAGTTIEVTVTATNAGGSATATSSGSPLTAPPGETASPSILGTAQVGHILTETPGHWTNQPTLTRQWYRCNSSYAGCTAISGATGTTYAPTAADVGGVLQVWETAANPGGSVTAYSPFTVPVSAAPGYVPVPAVTSSPRISGRAAQGAILRASAGAWSGNPGRFGYQWVRCAAGCADIPGATGASYTVAGGDVGSRLAVQVTAANSGGAGSAARSALTGTVTTPTTTSVLADPSQPVTDQGVTLTATVTTGTGGVPPRGSVSFTNNGAGIGGCVDLTLQTADQSGTVACRTAFIASTARVVATYQPTGGSLATGSASPASTLLVDRAGASVSLTVVAHPIVHTKATFTVKVAPPAGSVGGVTPTGSVRFTDGTRAVKGCGARALTHQTATCTVRYSAIAHHRISAQYSGDGNFTSGRSATRTVAVSPIHPTGFVAAFMSWTFGYHPAYTQITQLLVTNVAKGMTISLTCAGPGCRFRNRHVTVGPARRCGHAACSAPNTVNLLSLVRRAHLRPGATLTVRITHRLWIGKYYRFAILSGHRPQISEACLAVNSVRPGLGCTGA